MITGFNVCVDRSQRQAWPAARWAICLPGELIVVCPHFVAGSRANARAGCRRLRTSVSAWSRSACVPLCDGELERKGMAMPLRVLIPFLVDCLFQRRCCFVSGVVSSNAIAF
jgi:hypothetical protein